MANGISNFLQKYNELITEEYSKIRIIKDDDKKIQMNLDDVYIPLILKGNGSQENHNIEKYEAKDLLLINMQRIIVLGEPGMGKSTMLRYIAGNTCRSKEKSPVYIKLSEFSEHIKLTKDADRNDELEEYIIKKVIKIEKSRVEENVNGIEEAFKNGNMLILLDGMDEVTDENYKLVEEKIIDFSIRNNKCKIIMTSRKNNFKADQFSENIFEIDELSLDKICKYIDVFYCKYFYDDISGKTKTVKALESQIKRNPEIHRMAKNPFLLSILCLIGKNGEVELPRYRVDLYDRCCELLLEYRDLDKVKNKNCDIRMKKIVLKEVAYNIFIEGKEVVEKDFILNIIKDQIASVKYRKCIDCTEDECLDSLCNANEILRKFGVGKYEFVHRTVCEYYASKKLCEKKNVFELINNNMWEEPIKLYVAQIKSSDEADSFLMEIIEKDKGLALRSCLEMSKKILKADTIRKIFNKINLSQRVELIEGLIYSTEDNGKKVLDTLKVLLENETDLEIMGHAILKLEGLKKLNVKNDDLINNEIDRLIESVIGSKEVQKQRYIDYVEKIMVPIKGKEFVMGSPKDEPERCLYWSNKENKVVTIESETQHNVVVSDFYISKFPITIEIFKTFIKSERFTLNRVDDRSSYIWKGLLKKKWVKVKGVNWQCGVNGKIQNDLRHPVIHANWFEAYMFCRLLGCSLPTEAQWEFACRAGSEKPFSTGENLTTDQANYNGNYPYNGNKQGKYISNTTPVESYMENEYKLFDLHGNVLEWCLDWFEYEYFDECKKQGVMFNPSGPTEGLYRVLRGGRWDSDAKYCRSAYRSNDYPINRRNGIGFRVVRST